MKFTFRGFALTMAAVLVATLPMTALAQKDDKKRSKQEKEEIETIVKLVDAAMAGQPAPEPSEEDNVFLGTVILGSGIPTSEVSLNFAGSWIGAKMMRDIAAERFAAE